MVDVSNSMMATDVLPNRLERAKLLVSNLVDRMSELWRFEYILSRLAVMPHAHFFSNETIASASSLADWRKL